MITMKELGAPIRQWVPDWLGLICIFIVILPVTMLNGSYTGSMLEVSNTLGTNTEDITMGYYAAAAGMAVSYPIIPKILEAFSIKFLLLADLVAQFFLSWICARSQNADILIVCSFAIGFLKGFLMLWFIRYAQKIFSPKNIQQNAGQHTQPSGVFYVVCSCRFIPKMSLSIPEKSLGLLTTTTFISFSPSVTKSFVRRCR
jgi:hypothetical protein